MCVEVWREYNNTFADRQQLLQAPLKLADLQRLYPTVADLISSDEYKRLKRVAGVYVLAGSLVASRAIRLKVIYRYISVPRELWEEHLPLVKYLRREYYPELWLTWEQLVNADENRWSRKRRYFR